MELLKSNLAMMRRLQKADSSTRFDDLQSEWTEKKRLRGLVAVPSKRRVAGLVPPGGMPHPVSVKNKLNKAFDFAARNQSVDPVAATEGDPERHEMRKSRLL